MKKQVLFFCSIILFICVFCEADSYFVEYKEQYYRLYHIHLHQQPDDIIENIYWLSKAVNADFCNPLYALCKITTPKEWEKYRYMFMMHLNLKLTEQHVRLASKFDKQAAYFYNAPWKEQNIDSLGMAEKWYQTALIYWNEAKIWAEKANVNEFRFIFLNDMPNWEEEKEKIALNRLNYERTINRELQRLSKVREDFMNMNDSTY